MKRFHIHLAVDNLQQNVAFYSALFQTAPSVLKEDYAKWLLEDPRINFAISCRSRTPGLDHLGIQVESGEELENVQQILLAAALPVTEQKQTACCYAKSDKYWTTDPQGIAWEAFHSLHDIPMFGKDAANRQESTASSCCGPATPG